MRILGCVVLLAACGGSEPAEIPDSTPSLEVFPSTPTTVVNGRVAFTASNVVTWASDGGSIDEDGVFTAPATTGVVHVSATRAGLTVEATVTVVDPPPAATLAPVVTTSFPGVGFNQGRLVDFDDDGDLDAILADIASAEDTPVRAHLFRNDGTGAFALADEALIGDATTMHPRDFVVADLTGDGRDDVVIADHGWDFEPFPGAQSRILVQDSAGRLVDETDARFPAQTRFTHNVCEGDIDGDGDVDLFLAHLDGSPELYRNDGDGGFTAENAGVGLGFTACLLADLDRDGDRDLVLGKIQSTSAAADTIALNDGTGDFAILGDALPPRAGGTTWSTVGIEEADLNRDGERDLVMAIYDETFTKGRVQLLLGRGDATFVDVSAWLDDYPMDMGGMIWAVPIDLGGDGWPSVIASGDGFIVHLFEHDGDAPFPATAFDAAWGRAWAGDLDGDGDQDVFLHGFGTQIGVAENLRIP